MHSMKLDTVGKSSADCVYPQLNAVEFWQDGDGLPAGQSQQPLGCAPCRRSRGKPLHAIGIVSYGQMSDDCQCLAYVSQISLEALCESGTWTVRDIFWRRTVAARSRSRRAFSLLLEGLFQEAQPNESSLRRCLQCMCRRLRLLLGLMPEIGRAHV